MAQTSEKNKTNDETPRVTTIHTALMLTKANMRHLTDAQLKALSDWALEIRFERMKEEWEQTQIKSHYKTSSRRLIKRVVNFIAKLKGGNQ